MSRIFNERRERAIFYVFKNYNSGRSALFQKSITCKEFVLNWLSF